MNQILMVDLLVAWGVTQAVGFIFKPILEDLAKDAAKDWAKDLFKDSLKNVIRLPKKEPLDIAAGKALKEFLQLIQDELEDAEISEEQLKAYTKPLKQFLKDKSVKEILGSAFKDDCQVLETRTLAKIWYQLDLSSLPDEFNWERVGKKYLKKAKAIIRESDELRSIIDSQNLESIQQNTQKIAGIVPEFDLRQYQEGLQERYGSLNLDSLDSTVYDYRERLKVSQVFIAQNVRETQEYLPQVYEMPKEHQKRLRDSNQLETEIDLEEGERYKQAIKTSKAIGELAGNPLLLTMMAILNRNQELPRDRPELYNQASRLLLHQWDVEQKLLEDSRIDSVTIDYKDKQAILRQVAYHMQAAEQGLAGNLISADDLEKILIGYLKSIEVSESRKVARLLIEQLRTRNFILCFLGADSYGFVHRTFLEYFCACKFVERFGKRGLEGGLSMDELKKEVFGKHWKDESWHEVLRLITGMIDTSFAGEIIDYLMALDGEEEKFVNLFLAAECLLEVRNRNAIASTATQLLKTLKSLTKYDLNYDYEPDEYEPDEDEASLVWKIRTPVVSAVATTWKDDPDTLPWLKQRATNDDLWVVRIAAVQELARGWKDHPDTLPLLKQRAQTDDDLDVRSTAVQELANGWKDDPDTLPWLKQRATNDNEPFVRSTVLEELSNGWKDEPWMFEFLYNCALNDPFERVIDSWEFSPRQIALNLIIKIYPNHPQTLPLLQDRAENDPDKEVREFANNKLAELEKEN